MAAPSISGCRESFDRVSAQRENRCMQLRWARAIGVILCALIAVLVCSKRVLAEAESESVREYDLKAAYLYNFAKFTSWPDSTFTAPQSPMVVGVLGNQRLISALETVTRGRLVGG